MNSTHCLYHLHAAGEDTTEGYIGVTKHLRSRLYNHRAAGRLLDTDSITILFVGPEDVCLLLERLYRPVPGIGRNVAEGGWNKTVGSIGKATRIRAGQRLSKQTEFMNGQVAHNAGATQYVLIDPLGKEHVVTNLTTFCNEHGLTRENIRKVARGSRKHAKGWTVLSASSRVE